MIDVLALSNQDSVRANSIKSEKIDLEDHKKWFARKIEDENTIMLKSLTGNQFSGQVRLDIEGDTALIGVSVSEDFQGKGIGSDLLQAAIEKAKEQGLKAIEAFIKPENSGSRRLFEKNGWIFQEETETDGVRLLKYIYTIGKE